jgi:hypothetical protein
MPGELITLWTVRASLAFAFAAAMLAILNVPASASADSVKRRSGEGTTTSLWPLWLWTLACAFFLAHVAAAFHFYHHWRHADAIQHTAERTEELVGWNFGGGLYFNYAFALIWVVDVVFLWWRRASIPAQKSHSSNAPGSAIRSIWWCFFLFMVVNGAIVFVTGPTRWLTSVALLLLAMAWLCARSASSR